MLIVDYFINLSTDLNCPPGTIYDPCTSPCPDTCGSNAMQDNCTDDTCIESCRCPDGQVLDGDNCVDPSECGCTLESGEYVPVRYFNWRFKSWWIPAMPASTTQNIGCPSILTPSKMGKTKKIPSFILILSSNCVVFAFYWQDLFVKKKLLHHFIGFI